MLNADALLLVARARLEFSSANSKSLWSANTVYVDLYEYDYVYLCVHVCVYVCIV